jgi:hypothetical protein
MSVDERQAAMVEVIAKRLVEQRIPRALELKDKLDRGERLNDFDIGFLGEALADATNTMNHIDKHPEWQEVSAKLIDLYREITAKALENESSG